MNRRQYITGTVGALAGVAGCVGVGPDPDEGAPYDFSIRNWGSADVVDVRMRRGSERVFGAELQMAPGETWDFEGEPRGAGTLTVVVVANGYSAVREWSNPTGANVLRADVREDGVEFSMGVS